LPPPQTGAHLICSAKRREIYRRGRGEVSLQRGIPAALDRTARSDDFRVADTGSGISAEELTRHLRALPSRHRFRPNWSRATRLGSRHHATDWSESMGGSLDVNSEPGKGRALSRINVDLQVVPSVRRKRRLIDASSAMRGRATAVY